MGFEFRRWTPTLKLAILFLIFFFLASNFSSLWLFHQARKALESEIKAKLEASAVNLSNLLEETKDPAEAQLAAQAYLREQGLIALGISRDNSLPQVLTNPENPVPFLAGSLETEVGFRGPLPFAERYTSIYYFHRPSGDNIGTARAVKGFVAIETAQLGELQESLRRQIAIWVIGFVIMLASVILLWQFILAPFAEMEKRAESANLSEKAAGDDPAQAMVQTFEKVIAELKAKEAELSRLYRESEEKAEHYSALSSHLIESLSSGVVILNQNGEMVDSNPAAEALLVLENKTAPSPQLKEIFARMRAEKADEMELELESSGRKKTVAVFASAISNREGKLLGRALLLYDLTGLKDMEKKLEENKHWIFLGETAAGLAHELRNALAVMVGYAKLLAKALGKAPANQKTAHKLLKEAQSAEETLKSFLDYARPQAAEREKLDLKTLLEESIPSLQTRFPNVRFTFSLPEKMSVTGDATLLRRIFSNLLRNGAEACRGSGEIQISSRWSAGGEAWKIRFADSGPGVPPEHRAKIFSPFFTTKPEGTGLGLALVKKAVHLLEGKIELEDSERGAVFVLSLPAELRGDAQKHVVQKQHHV